MQFSYDATNATTMRIEIPLSRFSERLRRLSRATDAFTATINDFCREASKSIAASAIRNRSASIAVVREMAREDTSLGAGKPGTFRTRPSLRLPRSALPGRFAFYQGAF